MTKDCSESERGVRLEDVVSERWDRRIVEWLERLQEKEK